MTPAKYWIVVLACAAALSACGGHSGSPLPFVPQAATPSTTDDADLLSPDLQRCALDKNQPGWVFRGVCKYVKKLTGGKTVLMPPYAGFNFKVKLPKNNAGARQTIIVAVATRTDVAANKGRHRLGGFPTDKSAFLYFKTVNQGTTIRFRKNTSVVFTITNNGGTAFGTPCTIGTIVGKPGSFSWKTLSVAGKLSGKILTYTVPRKHYLKIPHGPAYYSFTCASAPSPSPSPSPTPTSKPKPTPTPAYCANYSVPTTNTVQLNVKDKSGLGASVIMYVWNGRAWMDNSGGFTTPMPSANPIPLDCFPGSVGKRKGAHFALPPNLAATSRLYISYSASTSKTVVPNPLGNMPNTGPTLTYGDAYWNVPWDVVELGTTAGSVVDLTALTKVGLPIELAQAPPGSSPFSERAEEARPAVAGRALPAPCATSAPGIIGVTGCNYANIYTAMSSIPQYQNLVATGSFNGKIVDMRILNPTTTIRTWDFGSDWFYNPAYLGTYPPACSGVPTPLANGYLSCVLKAYATTTRLYTTAGSGFKVTNHNYCVSSDGSANFGMTDVGSATSCAGITYSSPNTHAIPIALYKYGTPPLTTDGRGCQPGFAFTLPPTANWITKGKGKHPKLNVFHSADALAVWKAIAIDLNRGAALSTASHPAGGWLPSATPAAFSNYYNDPVSNEYAQILHTYYDHNLAYALAFDTMGGQRSAFTYVSGNALYMMVNQIPTAASVAPSSTPVPFPTPNPCPVFPTNVGS